MSFLAIRGYSYLTACLRHNANNWRWISQIHNCLNVLAHRAIHVARNALIGQHFSSEAAYASSMS
jgi:hypothetical protein